MPTDGSFLARAAERMGLTPAAITASCASPAPSPIFAGAEDINPSHLGRRPVSFRLS